MPVFGFQDTFYFIELWPTFIPLRFAPYDALSQFYCNRVANLTIPSEVKRLTLPSQATGLATLA